MEHIDEIRLKNAINCQAERGAKACIHCPYLSIDDDKCDTRKIAMDALRLINDMDGIITALRKEINSIYIKDGLYTLKDF